MQRITSKYKTDGGQVFPILINPQTELLNFGSVANAPTVLEPTTDASLAIRKDVRENGITSRKIYVVWKGEPPLGYAGGRGFYIPILTPELFLAISQGQTGQYIGTDIVVRRKIRERTR